MSNQWVQDNGARVQRRIFSDAQIHQDELERVFGRSWLFLAHETQLKKAGDYLTTFMGETPVIVIRQEDGSISAFLNACTHRGMLLSAAEGGCAKSFTCPYHGWVFGADGSLRDIRPEGEHGYGPEFNKDDNGLHQIRVESYKGLYFGNFSDDAPGLRKFLGDFAWYLDMMFDPLPTGVEFLGGTMRQRLKCNWKLASENIFADTYHVFAAHAVAASVVMEGKQGMAVGIEGGGGEGVEDISVSVSGHSLGANTDGHGSFVLFRDPTKWFAYVDKQRPHYEAQLGEERAAFIGSSVNGGVFPNFMFVPGFTYRQIHPKGPNECEIWMWTVVDKELPEELKQEMVRFNARMLGTSGMFESDDCANMERIDMTVRSGVGGAQWSDYSMAAGKEGHHPVYPGLVGPRMSDNGFRGYYRRWAEYMDADSVKDVPPVQFETESKS